jgi:hypothetical protein
MNSRLSRFILDAGLLGMEAAEQVVETGKKVVEIGIEQVVRGTAPLRSDEPVRPRRTPQPETAPEPPIEVQIRRAPALTLTAAGSGRQLRLDALGRPALLLCHGQDNAAAARDVNVALQSRNPGGTAFYLLHILDLSNVPGLLRGAARRELEKVYRSGAAYLDDPAEAPERVYLLADWQGSAAPALGLGDVRINIGLAALNKNGGLLETRQGDNPVQTALEMLDMINPVTKA